MAITLKTITGKIVIPGTTIGIRAKVTATPMTTAQALTFPADDTISWGPVEAVTDANGYLPASFKIPTNSAQQSELLWKFTAEPVDKHGSVPKSWLMGHYEITGTGSIGLDDLVNVDVNAFDQATFVSLQSLVASGQAAATASAASATSAAASASVASTLVTTDLNTTDGQSFALVTDPNSLTGAALEDKFASRAGGNEYQTVTPVLGEVGWFPNTGAAAPVIAEEDYILWQPFAKNSIATPRVWAANPVVVKDVKSPAATNPLVIGLEVSATNDTDEANDPNPYGSNGSLIGLYVSYINVVHQGSAAMYVTGIAATTDVGWKHGLYLDGITTGGTGISLHNAVGANPMGVGIDLSTHAGNFSVGAIILGNAHRILGKKTDGSGRELIYMSALNEMVLGDVFTQDCPMHFYASEYVFSGIATTNTATAGFETLPAGPAQFMPVTVAGVDYKIPLYNV